MAKIRRRPAEEQLLEGGGGGFGSRTSIMPRLNKPAKEGLQYRSPEQTNARSMTPHPLEDVVGSQRADIGRIRQGLNAPGRTERGRTTQQEGAGRAITRTMGRAGAAGAAGLGGAEIGKRLRDRADAEKMRPDAEMESSMGSEEAPMPKPRSRPRPRPMPEPTSNIREGRNENIDDETRARAMESVGMRKGGMTQKYAKGGSVSSRADGIAQRGKTRGKIC